MGDCYKSFPDLDGESQQKQQFLEKQESTAQLFESSETSGSANPNMKEYAGTDNTCLLPPRGSFLAEEAKKCFQLQHLFGLLFTIYVGIGLFWFMYESQFTFIDSMFIIVTIITTVGYGIDIEEDAKNQIFLIAYSILGVSVLGTAIQRACHMVAQNVSTRKGVKFVGRSSMRLQQTRNSMISVFLQRKTYMARVCTTIYENIFFVIWIVWILFGASSMQVLEGWTFIEGLYFAVITGSTIGFGDYIPVTNQGKIFTIIYVPLLMINTILVYSPLFMSMMQNFMDEEKEEQKRLKKTMKRMMSVGQKDRNCSTWLDNFDVDGDASVSEAEFMLQILINQYDVPRHKIEFMKKRFATLDVDGNGMIDIHDVLASDPERATLP